MTQEKIGYVTFKGTLGSHLSNENDSIFIKYMQKF